jgi:hypothetical protein
MTVKKFLIGWFITILLGALVVALTAVIMFFYNGKMNFSNELLFILPYTLLLAAVAMFLSLPYVLIMLVFIRSAYTKSDNDWLGKLQIFLSLLVVLIGFGWAWLEVEGMGLASIVLPFAIIGSVIFQNQLKKQYNTELVLDQF